MVPVKTFGVMYDQTIFYRLQITKSDIRPQVKIAVSLMTTDGLQDLCGVCMGLPHSLYHLRWFVNKRNKLYSMIQTRGYKCTYT